MKNNENLYLFLSLMGVLIFLLRLVFCFVFNLERNLKSFLGLPFSVLLQPQVG